jgi:hypothetical protein
MPEYFVTARSFAAPFFSDTSEEYVEAQNVRQAMELFTEDYSHPGGLYAFEVWASADDFHKRKAPLDTWRSPEAACCQDRGAER